MTDLSPAAQYIWEAFNEDEAGVFVDYGDKLAAALRAAADRIAVPNQPNVTIWESGFCAGISSAQEALRVIAAELEGDNEPTFTPEEIEMIAAPWSYLQSQQELENSND